MKKKSFLIKIVVFLIIYLLFSHLIIGKTLLDTSVAVIHLNLFVLLLVMCLICLIVIMRMTLIFDNISFLQLLMLVYLLIPVGTGMCSAEFFWGNYLSFVTAFIIYLAIQNSCNIYPFVLAKLVSVVARLYANALIFVIVCKSIELFGYGIFSSAYKLRFVTKLGGSNNIGFYLLFLFFVIYFTRKNTYDKFLIFMLFVCMLLISSRGTLLSFFVVCLFAHSFFRICFFACAIPSLLCALVFSQIILENLGRYLPFVVGFGDNISSGRFVILSRACSVIWDNIFFGVGFGNFTIPEFYDFSVQSWRPHNIFLEIQLGGGLIASLLFIITLLVVFVRLRGVKQYVPLVNGIYFGFIAILVQGMIEPNIFNYRIDTFLWFFVGMAMMISRKVNIDKNRILRVSTDMVS